MGDKGPQATSPGPPPGPPLTHIPRPPPAGAPKIARGAAGARRATPGLPMAEAEPRRRARGLLASYYGGSDGADASASGDPLDDVNIDASNFNATKYVSSLLQ
eukprot:scaffold21510_cov111-Isochrysis_galbana.AAC.3